VAALAAEANRIDSRTLEVWSAGCASGEEPYTIAMMRQLEPTHRFPDLSIQLLATVLDRTMLTRARAVVASRQGAQAAARALARCGLPAAGGVAALHARPLQARHDVRAPRHPPVATSWLVRSGDVAILRLRTSTATCSARPPRGLLRFCDPQGPWSSAAMKRYREISMASSRGALLIGVYRRVGTSRPRVSDSG
jgi:hypothetical protein